MPIKLRLRSEPSRIIDIIRASYYNLIISKNAGTVIPDMILRLKHNIKYITLVVGILIASTIIVLVSFSIEDSNKILAVSQESLTTANVSGDLPPLVQQSICNYDNPNQSSTGNINDSNSGSCGGTAGFPSACYNRSTSYSPDLLTWLSKSGSPSITNISDPNGSPVKLQFNQLDFTCYKYSQNTSALQHYTPGSSANIGIPGSSDFFMKEYSVISAEYVNGNANLTIPSGTITSTIQANHNNRFSFNSPFSFGFTPNTAYHSNSYTITFNYFAAEEFSQGYNGTQPVWSCVANGGATHWLNSSLSPNLPLDTRIQGCPESSINLNINISSQQIPEITALTGIVTNQTTPMTGVTVQACNCAGECGANDVNAAYGGISTTNSNGQYTLYVVNGSNTCISIQTGGPLKATPTLNTDTAYSGYTDKSQYEITNWTSPPPPAGWNFYYNKKSTENCDPMNTVCLSVIYSCSSVTVTGNFPNSYATAILSSPNPSNNQYYQYYNYQPIYNNSSFTFYPLNGSSDFPNGQYTVDLTWQNITPSVSFTLNCYTPPTLTYSSSCNSISGSVSQSPGDTESVTVTLGLPGGTTQQVTATQSGGYTFPGSDYGSQVYGSSGSFELYATNSEGSSTPVSFNIGPCGNVCMYGSSGCSSVASSVPTETQACSVNISPSGPIETGAPASINYNIAYYEYGTNANNGTPTISGTTEITITNSSSPPTSFTTSYSIDESSSPGTSSISNANTTEDSVTGLSAGDYTISLTFNGTFDNGTYSGTLPQQQCSSTFVVANEPYFRVYGGDITAGQGFSSGIDSCNQESASVIGWNEGSNGNYAGAGGQFAVIAPGSQNDPGIINYLVTGDWLWLLLEFQKLLECCRYY